MLFCSADVLTRMVTNQTTDISRVSVALCFTHRKISLLMPSKKHRREKEQLGVSMEVLILHNIKYY